MPRKLALLLFLILPLWSMSSAEMVDLGTGTAGVEVTVVRSDDLKTVVNFKLGAFSRESVIIDGREYSVLKLDRESIRLNQGEPELPRVCRSIIIPDAAEMKINILAAEYIDFPETPIVPSKGNLPRTIDPRDIPYTFGSVYDADEWYPAHAAEIREPFILRDYRGTVVEFNAFQYHPGTQTLRVYSSMTVEVVNVGPGKINVLSSSKRAESTVPEFEQVYRRRFINYSFLQGKYASVPERGDLLIITYDEFHPLVQPLAEWKKQKGIKTWIVDISSIGNDGTLIADYIQRFYEADSTNLAYVLLVGDHAQINRPIGTGHSDPVYAKVAGYDNYPDILIGRFSAESPEDVLTQVERTIEYESSPFVGEWLHRGTGIGSDDPTVGQDGEIDWQHIDLIRVDLLNFTYTEIDQFYEYMGIGPADVAAAVNDGRSIINYTGHGAWNSWSTSGFSNYHVNNLVNTDHLPFIFSVACNNGQFDTYTCFAESWLRAVDNDAPAGAMAFYGSLISQSWTPPMNCQDEINDLLCSRDKNTFGGLCFNGACRMIEMDNLDGAVEYDAWTIFGDPSLQVRTDIPESLMVIHDKAAVFTASEFEVQVLGEEGALCALYSAGRLYGSAYTDPEGMAVIPLSGFLPVGENVTLTVTAFNRIAHIDSIPVISPLGPYLVYAGHVVDDAAFGNDNGLIDAGENIQLGITLKNVGPDTAYGAVAAISTSDPFISCVDDRELYGNIAGDFAISYIPDGFAFEVATDIPDGHIIPIHVTMASGGTDNIWSGEFSLVAHAPVLEFLELTIDDGSGNGNGILDPGETASLIVTINNSGSGSTDQVAALLSEDDPYLSLKDNAAEFGFIEASGGIASNDFDALVVTADAACPRGHEVIVRMDLAAAYGFPATVYFSIVVGDRVVFFADDFSFNRCWEGLGRDGEWTIGPAVGGHGSDSHGNPDPAIDHTPTSDNRVLGNDLTADLGGDYNAGLGSTDWVTSPVIDCSDYTGVRLRFQRQLGIEDASRDQAYLEAFDGSEWVTLFVNVEAMDESSWGEQVYDISAIADGNDSFRIRFGLGPTDGAANYGGWNIDDLSLQGYGAWRSADIAFETEALYESLIPGDTIIDSLVMYNMSITSPLEIHFNPDDSWLGCGDEPISIDPGGRGAISVKISATGMEPGDYVGHMSYSCNDYLHPYGEVPIYLHLYAPRLEIMTALIEAAVEFRGSTTRELALDNTGPGRLYYETDIRMFHEEPRSTALPEDTDLLGIRAADADKSEATEPYFRESERTSGGPDLYGYEWIDSDDPEGPSFSWVDISSVGMPLPLVDDGYIGPLPVGFEFPFYGRLYDQIYIGSNGFLTFGSGSALRINSDIPDTTDPDNFIAVWWDDLDPPEGGRIFYYPDYPGRRLIVSYEEIGNYVPGGSTGSLTFQVILYSDGRIEFHYGKMDPGTVPEGLSGSTIGLENSDGSDGLQVAYNAPYMHDSLTISFRAVRWLSVTPSSGVVEPYSSSALTVGFDSKDLEPGLYSGEVLIMSNDPDAPGRSVPAFLTVANFICGDANSDGGLDVGDVVFLINHIFKGGPAPDPIGSGDANGDSFINVADAVYLINHLFHDGQPPPCP